MEINNVLIQSLCSCGVLVVFSKWGIDCLYTSIKKPYMPDWCEFCLLFWIAIIITSVKGFHMNFLYLFYKSMATAFLSIFIYKIYEKISNGKR